MQSKSVVQNLPKHEKYRTAYQPNDFFWGLGVEHETYLESITINRQVTLNDVLTLQKPERYSVSYYKSYKPLALIEGIQTFFQDISSQTSQVSIEIPILLNAHAFQRTDIHNNSKTTYEKNPQPNPKFSGKTLHEELCEKSPWHQDQYDCVYLYDGDTIEFTTLNFYKADVSGVIRELAEQHDAFLENLNAIQWPEQSFIGSLAPFRIQSANHPFATYTTNLKNIAMFNNGTIHINITLPTQLDGSGEIADWKTFVRRHQILARLIQWVEPLMISVYGTPDPFSQESRQSQYIYGGSSQRLAVSRYIGVGTFDTVTMPVGKILQISRASLPWQIGTSNGGWYQDCSDWAYEPLEQIGLDLNFNKHRNHGLELRFFDALPMKSLEEALEMVVLLGELAQSFDRDGQNLPIPQESLIWKKLAKIALERGQIGIVTDNDIQSFFSIFSFKLQKNLPADRELRLSEAYGALRTCFKEYVKCKKLNEERAVIEVNNEIGARNVWCCGVF